MLNLQTIAFLPAISRWRIPGGVGVLAFLVWGAVAFSAVTGGLRWSSDSTLIPIEVAATNALAEPDPQLVLRGLGGGLSSAPSRPDVASRIQLVGVLAAEKMDQGVAVLAVDGQPTKPYRVGQAVTDDLVLQATRARQAMLGSRIDGPPSLTLELPRNDK